MPHGFSNFNIYLFWLCVRHVSVGGYVCVSADARRASNVKSPGAGVPGSCELPNVDAGNQTGVLWRTSKCY